ncbi:MAG: ATP-binding protein [Bdellovibrionaceae bacterium]|nr:ATP-binding protein [Pseudobdellovibrionaceae bacterium]
MLEDLSKDERFNNHPGVTGPPFLRFYAGFPLIENGGLSIGCLSVTDSRPQKLNSSQIKVLEILSRQVMAILKLRIERLRNQERNSLIERLSAQIPGVAYTYEMLPDGSSRFPFSTSAIRDIYEIIPEDVRDDAAIVFSLLHPNDLEEVRKSIQASAKNLTNWSLEYRVILPQKGTRWLRGFARPERTQSGSTLWHGFITDISEERALRAQISQNANLAALGEMASGIAHEINNPLSIILGKATLLKAKVKKKQIDDQILCKHLEDIEKTCQRINQIVRGLKNLGRDAGEDSRQSISIIKILEDVLGLLSEKLRFHRVEIKFYGDLNSSAEVNATQIGQVFYNLISNSFDAIQGLDANQKWINITVSKEPDQLVIDFVDGGRGIPTNVASRIMEPFFTTKPAGHGTGLGLSISKSIVLAHRGTLEYVPDAPNTTFRMTLPLTSDPT